METNTFDRLARLFARIATRRIALGSLFAITALGTVLETEAIKGVTEGKNRRARRVKRKKRNDQRRHTHSQAKSKRGNHCTTPFGLDLNVYHGISAQIVTPFCTDVGSGEKWIAGGAWIVNDTFEAVPDSFVPMGSTPLDDFRAKFTALKLVVDRGTRHQKAVVIPTSDNLFSAVAGDTFPGTPADWVLISPLTLGTVQPLRVGAHVVEVIWVFSAMHCDGIAANIDENCLSEGEVPFETVEFKVKPGHH